MPRTIAVTIVDDGFCNNSLTTNDEYGDYVWTETAVGEMHRLQCVFGPLNADATRQCASGGQWSGSIDYSSCFTRITKMYQMFDVVSCMLSSPTVYAVNWLFDLQGSVAEENVVEMIEDFAALVEMTDNTVDQSQRNFDVIANVLNVTSSIVGETDLNDGNLTQVQLTIVR